MRARGFTLVEMVVVIVITGIIAVTGVIFFKPVIDGYFDARRRAGLSDMADTALREMGRDIRSAVPNSIRWPAGSQCIEFLPTSAGGRYRMASDTVNDTPTPLPCTPSATCSAPLNISQPVTQFDVLSSLTRMPQVSDWVVIDNQNTNDVYAGVNAAQITAIATPAASAGLARISINSQQFPSGYNAGRFVVVPNNNNSPAVIYGCYGADGTLDAAGNGKGTLYRVSRALVAAYPASCPAATGGTVVASNVQSCNLVYNASQDGTQQSGFVWLQLQLTQAYESVTLAYGVHVDNVP